MRRARSGVVTTAIVAASVAGLSLSAGTALAGPRPRVGPHQSFDGLVNGHRGTSSVPVVVSVACAGPIRPGETGHPVAGQTVEILPAVPVRARSGFTGDEATSIEAFFGAPPPAGASRSTDSRSTDTVTFHRYALVRPIPRSIELPCSGTGQVTFVPFPRTPPTSRPAIVPVVYVGQP
jgi:hypothetical protein